MPSTSPALPEKLDDKQPSQIAAELAPVPQQLLSAHTFILLENAGSEHIRHFCGSMHFDSAGLTDGAVAPFTAASIHDVASSDSASCGSSIAYSVLLVFFFFMCIFFNIYIFLFSLGVSTVSASEKLRRRRFFAYLSPF